MSTKAGIVTGGGDWPGRFSGKASTGSVPAAVPIRSQQAEEAT
jgi:hypothetical protein